MKLKLKLPVILTLVMAVVGGTSSAAFADSAKAAVAESNVARAFVVEGGIKKELSIEEYDLLIKDNDKKTQFLETQKSIMKNSINSVDSKSSSETDSIAPLSLIDLSRYSEAGFIGSVYRNDLTRRISVPIYNDGTTTITRNISFTASQSYTSNVSLSSTYSKNAFSAGVTVGSSWSKTISNSDSVSQPIPPKKYSWMQYTPNMSNSYGTLYEEVWSFDGASNVKVVDKSYFVDVYIAKTGNAGLPDGLYTVKETTTAPN